MLLSDLGEVPKSLFFSVFFGDCLDEYADFVANGFWYVGSFGTVSRN